MRKIISILLITFWFYFCLSSDVEGTSNLFRKVRGNFTYSEIYPFIEGISQKIIQLTKTAVSDITIKITSEKIFYEYLSKGKYTTEKKSGKLSQNKDLIFKLLTNGIAEIEIAPKVKRSELVDSLNKILCGKLSTADNVKVERDFRASFIHLENWDEIIKPLDYFFKILQSEKVNVAKFIKAADSIQEILRSRKKEISSLSNKDFSKLSERISYLLYDTYPEQDKRIKELIGISQLLSLNLIKKAVSEAKLKKSLIEISNSLASILKSELHSSEVKKSVSRVLAVIFEAAYQNDMPEFLSSTSKKVFLSSTLEKDIISGIIKFGKPSDVAKVAKSLIMAEKFSEFEDYSAKIFSILTSASNLKGLEEVAHQLMVCNNSNIIQQFIDSIIEADINLDNASNVDTLLEIITLNPSASRKLINYLTMRFRLAKPELKDSIDLLQQISYLLSSDIDLEYFNIRTLLKSIPFSLGKVVYTDAEWGNIRSFSRALDATGGGRLDVYPGMHLCEYLRNQIHHLGQSNLDITLVKRILAFWLSGDKEWLRKEGKRIKNPIKDEVVDNLPSEDLDIEGKKQALLLLLDIPNFYSSEYSTLKQEVEELLENGNYFKAVSAFKKIEFDFDTTEKLKKLNREEVKHNPNIIVNILKSIGLPPSSIEKATSIDVVDILESLWMVELYQGLVEKYGILERNILNEVPPALLYQKGNRESMLKAARNFINKRAHIRKTILSDISVKPYSKIESDDITDQTFGEYEEKRFDLFNQDRYLEIYGQRLFSDLINETIQDLKIAVKKGQSLDIRSIVDVISLVIQNVRIDGLGGKELDHIVRNLEVGGLDAQQILNLIQQIPKQLSSIRDKLVDDYRKVANIAANQIDPQELNSEYYDEQIVGEEIYPAGTKAVIDLEQIILEQHALNLLSKLLEWLEKYLTHNIDYTSSFLPLFSNVWCRRIRGKSLILPPKEKLPEVVFITDYSEEEVPPTSLFGKKGVNLITLAQTGLNVPDGFIISTEITKDILQNPNQYKPGSSGDEDFRRLVANYIVELEKKTGKRFGGSISQPYLDQIRKAKGIDIEEQKQKDPLFLASRSGSALTLPGVLATIINIGIGGSESDIERIGKNIGDLWAAWDSYRRFLQSFATHVYGREPFIKKYEVDTKGGVAEEEQLVFDNIIETVKEEKGVSQKSELTPGQMRKVALLYKKEIKKRIDKSNPLLEGKPFEQLMVSIYATIKSWNSKLAQQYRAQQNISNQWGTPVIIQTMAWGEYAQSSGSGVLVTSSPLGGIVGEFKSKSQGSDIMLGRSANYIPISSSEAKPGQDSLESIMPGIYNKLSNIANKIEHIIGDVQEVEFVIERGKIRILQTREERRSHIDLDDEKISPGLEQLEQAGIKDEEGEFKVEPISFGTPNFKGGFMGRVAFDETTIIKAIEESSLENYNFILFYDDIGLEDMEEIWLLKRKLSQVNGHLFIMCKRGGIHSHAVEVAGGSDVPALVKVSQMEFDKGKAKWKIGDSILEDLQDILYIDQKGNIYLSPLH